MVIYPPPPPVIISIEINKQDFQIVSENIDITPPAAKHTTQSEESNYEAIN